MQKCARRLIYCQDTRPFLELQAWGQSTRNPKRTNKTTQIAVPWALFPYLLVRNSIKCIMNTHFQNGRERENGACVSLATGVYMYDMDTTF